MNHQLIEIKHLDRSPLNVRKTEARAALEELKGSILAHGLMQNLVVVPAKKGKYLVIAGGRRLEALHELQAEGKLPGDHAVHCQIAEGEQAVELSLAENTVRLAMHPADEFEAFAELIERGQSAEQIAVRFGTTEKHVLQRMKLGRVAPELLAAYRAEELSLDSLMAFAVTDDLKRQISVWKSLEGWQENNPRQIRQRLTEKMVDGTHKLAAFVGVEAYKAAGGTVRADLFSEVTYLEDVALLERLAAEKLEAEADKVRQEGWGWVQLETDEDALSPYRCRRIQPKAVGVPPELLSELEQAEQLQAAIASEMDATDEADEEAFDALIEREREIDSKLDEIEESIAAYRQFDPEEIKAAGCLVSIDHDGELDIEKGLVRPEDRVPDGGYEQPTSFAADSAKPKREYSQQLLADLAAYRTQAAQVVIASHPAIAFDLLVFHVATELWCRGRIARDGFDVHFRQSYVRPSVEPKNSATARLDELREGLSLAWLEVEGEDAQFAAFRELDHECKLAILAYCTALTLKPTLRDEGRDFPTAYEVSLSLTGGSVAALWRPTKDNYLSRVTRDQLFDIGRVFGKEAWVGYRKDAKKAALADELHGYFAKSHHPDTTDAVRNWLPKGMAFLGAPAEAKSVEAAEKPTRKPRQKVARSNAA